MYRHLANIFSTLMMCWNLCQGIAQHIPFSGNHSLTWQECIAAYDSLDKASNMARLIEAGTTDIGKPIHLFIINKDEVFYPELFDRNKNVLLINNSIHPGEPDGMDACVMLCRELLSSESELSSLLDSTIVCIIPVYNVDGALNRGSHSRANQNGPAAYGFRGNARNLDLNRDFIKCDSRNALSFSSIFTLLQPAVLVDTHVSNGADYPYTMTLISTQHNKLLKNQGKFLKEVMEPNLFEAMKKKGHEMCPYVNTMGRTPESGLVDFLETPRFATGYAALFNTIGFTTETHMLKPFAQRVESTYQFLVCMLEWMDENASLLHQQKKNADEEASRLQKLFLNYRLDTTAKSSFVFNGYLAENKPSEIGTGITMKYNHLMPWTKPVPHYRTYAGADEVTLPEAYIIPQAWGEAIERLKANRIRMSQLKCDTNITVTAYYIDDYETAERPYEGHYLHHDVKTKMRTQTIPFYKGDYVITCNQAANRYIAVALEPSCEDSFFAWNFFDSVLQQKEWFSDYVFEEIAAELLNNNPQLKKDFDSAMQSDPQLKDNHWNQLYWIYRHSPYFETSAFRYPVYRIEK